MLRGMRNLHNFTFNDVFPIRQISQIRHVYTLDFRYPQNQNSIGAKSGDGAGHGNDKFREMTLSPNCCCGTSRTLVAACGGAILPAYSVIKSISLLQFWNDITSRYRCVAINGYIFLIDKDRMKNSEHNTEGKLLGVHNNCPSLGHTGSNSFFARHCEACSRPLMRV
ncbi:hypothetical protein AVEN_210943-1 [Araneus ventricosus]|uniref:Uncharacterized protein n=1 Tax=Araneus ventricosus TaxID=182803 RepID=A0A4Y2DIB0_ARAVE|nr:hypothetical protein AVEN_210943-1 [Araneus ventricosus]